MNCPDGFGGSNSLPLSPVAGEGRVRGKSVTQGKELL